jgi:NAD(P)-dependent dehydrogenase (short-subunit alcohol dehydrogenase family)
MDLRGKTAVVTGGAVRLGRAFALALADGGANVVVHYGRSRDQAEATRAEIERRGARAVTVPADLLQPEAAAEAVFTAAASAFGSADVLINSAAIFEPGRLADGDAGSLGASFDRQLTINLKAPLLLSRRFAAQLGEGRRGHIVSIADWRATRPDPQYLAYTLSKAGLVTLTQALARELGPRVQVNAVAPGAVLPAPGMSEADFQRLGSGNLLGHTGTPDDIAGAVLYLLRSDFITGHLLYVDGGERWVK